MADTSSTSFLDVSTALLNLRYLQAANAQPWTPLNDNQRQYLMTISNLSPKREYYPPGLPSMQSIVWEEKLTTHIQNDGFQPLIARIIRGSDDLAMFYRNRIEQSEDSLSYDQHLLERSRHWDITYSRFRPHLPAEASVKLSRYAPRMIPTSLGPRTERLTCMKETKILGMACLLQTILSTTKVLNLHRHAKHPSGGDHRCRLPRKPTTRILTTTFRFVHLHPNARHPHPRRPNARRLKARHPKAKHPKIKHPKAKHQGVQKTAVITGVFHQ